MTTKTEVRRDIYQSITDQIAQAIEDGAATFQMPWRNSDGFPYSPINAVSKNAYRGINVLVLWAAAQRRGFSSGLWATFKQWQTLGGQVRKGERATTAVLWKFFDTKDNETEVESGDSANARRIPMVREYTLFNVAQVDGYEMKPGAKPSKNERIEEAERFFSGLEISLGAGGNRAYYCPTSDSVFMPPFEAFKQPLFYYSVLAHETTHWSGAERRLNRDLEGRFGSDSYAMEELIAELGAAFLCAKLNLPSDPRLDHAPYVATWLKVFKNDKKALFTAAARAQEAADWLVKTASTGRAPTAVV
ncbi:hypothetical protein F183_A21320 [Bryobacterales bacterium F-183]|nr:hypothetical protein F183_A21320 [Bryobacterales bacterium F-183]